MKTSRLSLFFVRIGIGIVFLWFGIGKFRNDIWAETMRNLPALQALPLGMDALIIIVGIIEIFVGLLLIIGLFTRWIAIIAVAMLAVIIILLGFSEMRDIGLLLCALSLVWKDSSFLSLDQLFHKS